MASLRKRGQVWYFRYVDADGTKRKRKGCSDRSKTKEMARAVESEVASIRSGLVNPRELAYREHESRPLSEHFSAWQANLMAQGFTENHANQTSNRARRLIAAMLGSEIALHDHRRQAQKTELTTRSKSRMRSQMAACLT